MDVEKHKIKEDKKQLISVRVERNGCLKVHIKTSPEIEEFFKTTVNGQTGTIRFTNKNYVMLTDESTQQDEALAYIDSNGDYGDLSEKSLLLPSGALNGAIIRFQGTSNGKTFLVKELISRDRLETGIKKFMEGIRRFYADNLKPCKIYATLHTTEI